MMFGRQYEHDKIKIRQLSIRIKREVERVMVMLRMFHIETVPDMSTGSTVSTALLQRSVETRDGGRYRRTRRHGAILRSCSTYMRTQGAPPRHIPHRRHLL